MIAKDIKVKYDEMKRLFADSPLNPSITDKFSQLNVLCQEAIATFTQEAIASQTTAAGKNYVVFKSDDSLKFSRPVNFDLYNAGLEVDASGKSKIDIFWKNVQNHCIADQSSEDITFYIR